jgi:hypothetical protein
MGLQCSLYLEIKKGDQLIYEGGTSTCCKELANALKVNAYGEQSQYDPAEDEIGYPELESIDWTKFTDCIMPQLANGKEEFDKIFVAVNNLTAKLAYYSSH